MLDQYLIDKRYYQSLAIEINTSISFLNLVCIMNEEQYRKVFVTKDQTMKLLKFLSSIFYVQEDHPDVAVPSILKAAVIKTFGYLIQHQNDAQYYSKSEYVCNTILDHCLSPLILQDPNINVQIRNSWTLSFICNLYPIEDIISCKLNSQKGSKITNFEILIQICLKYA